MMMPVVRQLVCFSSVSEIQFVNQSVVEQTDDLAVDGGFVRTFVFGKTGHQLFDHVLLTDDDPLHLRYCLAQDLGGILGGQRLLIA